VNEVENPNLDYLSDSIADAVREELKKRFVFKEMTPEKIAKFLKANEMQKEDWATSTVAYQLGTWEAQSVVISGRFRPKKRANGRDGVEITATIYSIHKKTKVNQFKTEADLSANMFDALAKVGASIAELSKDILPDPEQYRIAEAHELRTLTNLLLVRAGAFFAHTPTASSDLLASSQITTADFSLIPTLGIEYRRYAILLPELGFYASIDSSYRTADLSGRGTTVPATLFTFSGYAGPTYYYYLGNAFYLAPTLGMGYSYVSIALAGINPSLYTQTLKLGTLSAEARLNFGYRALDFLAVEFAPIARIFFYSGKTVADFGATASVGWKF